MSNKLCQSKTAKLLSIYNLLVRFCVVFESFKLKTGFEYFLNGE